jgi:trehalose 2-sulfotransferase
LYDLATASYDVEETGAGPRQCLLICTATRSGSTLLGEALHAAGGLGCPLEYFHRGFRPVFAQRWSAPDLPSYLRALAHHRVDPVTGVLSVKLLWNDLVELARELGLQREGTGFDDPVERVENMRILGQMVDRLLPGARYVFLQRADRVRRAVSALRADQTKRFRQFTDGRGPAGVVYDYDAILGHIDAHAAVDQVWQWFFEINGIAPIRVQYEDLASSYESTVGRVLDGLGHEGSAGTVAPPRLRRQADDLSEQLCRRFLHDHRVAR